MFIFGLTTCLQGLTQNYGGILAARFFLGKDFRVKSCFTLHDRGLLGLFESGMFPGCFYLLAMYVTLIAGPITGGIHDLPPGGTVGQKPRSVTLSSSHLGL